MKRTIFYTAVLSILLTAANAWGQVKPREISGAQPGASPIVYSPDGKKILFGSSILDVASGKIERQLETLPGGRYSLAISPDGKSAAGAGHAGMVGIWNLETGKLATTIQTASKSAADASYSADGKKLFIVVQEGLEIWDAQGTAKQKSIPMEGKTAGGVLSQRGNLLVLSQIGNSSLQLWDAQTGKRFPDIALPSSTGYAPMPLSIWGPVAISPDGKLAAVTAMGWTALVSLPSGKPAAVYRGSTMYLSFSQDSKLLAIGSWDTLDRPKNSVLVLDAYTNRQATFGPLPDVVRAVKFSPDGHQLAVTCDAGAALYLFDISK